MKEMWRDMRQRTEQRGIPNQQYSHIVWGCIESSSAGSGSGRSSGMSEQNVNVSRTQQAAATQNYVQGYESPSQAATSQAATSSSSNGSSQRQKSTPSSAVPAGAIAVPCHPASVPPGAIAVPVMVQGMQTMPAIAMDNCAMGGSQPSSPMMSAVLVPAGQLSGPLLSTPGYSAPGRPYGGPHVPGIAPPSAARAMNPMDDFPDTPENSPRSSDLKQGLPLNLPPSPHNSWNNQVGAVWDNTRQCWIVEEDAEAPPHTRNRRANQGEAMQPNSLVVTAMSAPLSPLTPVSLGSAFPGSPDHMASKALSMPHIIKGEAASPKDELASNAGASSAKKERPRPPKSKRQQGKLMAEKLFKAESGTQEERDSAWRQFLDDTESDTLLFEYASKVLQCLRQEAEEKRLKGEDVGMTQVHISQTDRAEAEGGNKACSSKQPAVQEDVSEKSPSGLPLTDCSKDRSWWTDRSMEQSLAGASDVSQAGDGI